MNKKTLICSLAVTLFSITGEMSFAQSAPAQTSETTALRSSRVRNPESIKRAKLTRLKKDVGPDEQQIQAITPIIDSYVESVQNVKHDPSLDTRARRQKLSELRRHYDSDIDARLTPEQQQKLASLKTERRARLRGAKASLETSQASKIPESSSLPAEIH